MCFFTNQSRVYYWDHLFYVFRIEEQLKNDPRYLHLLFTTVSKLLYSLGHVWATPYESPVHRDFHGRAIHLETEMRSPVSSWDPNDPDYIEYYMDHDDDYDPDYYPDGSPVLGRSYMVDRHNQLSRSTAGNKENQL